MPDKLQLEARKAVIVRRMFLETADQNYIIARLAALNLLYLDFFWMGLHAVEKYLKAILLFNGQSAASQRHDIERLSRDVLALHPALSWGQFVKPDIDVQPRWTDEKVSTYIARLNKRGDPNNRYLTYGFIFEMQDLLKLDQLVWQIRRHCRPFIQPVQKNEIDWVKKLQLNPQEWRLSELLPLERVLNGKDTLLQRASRALNEPFAPEVGHNLEGWTFAMTSSPLYDWYKDVQSEKAPPDHRELAAELLEWAMNNISMSKEDKNSIKVALDVRFHETGRLLGILHDGPVL
jgi:HEPN domain-containing protein